MHHCMLKNIIVCDEVIPMNVDDGDESVLHEELEETDAAEVGDPGLRAVEESDKSRMRPLPLELPTPCLPRTHLQVIESLHSH